MSVAKLPLNIGGNEESSFPNFMSYAASNTKVDIKREVDLSYTPLIYLLTVFYNYYF